MAIQEVTNRYIGQKYRHPFTIAISIVQNYRIELLDPLRGDDETPRATVHDDIHEPTVAIIGNLGIVRKGEQV